jgi:AraC family transcriptional regulator, transcriptional activator of pobA
MSRPSIPQYFLYGETTQDVDERFLHVESIAERSRRHNWTIRPHAHRDLYHLLLVVKGGGVFDCEGASQSFGSNTLIGVPPSCVHGFEFKTSTDGWIVTASGALLARITREHAELASAFEESYVVTVDPPAVSATQALFSSLVFEFRGNLPLRRAAAESWLTTIAISSLRRRLELSPVTRMKSADSILASRYRLMVEANFRSPWGVADYAAKLCISSERLRVACVQTTASSPLALLNARRLLEAKRSLLYTNMNIALVAEACGFADPAYFSRFFTRSTGKSPRAYRLGTRESFTR